MKLKWNRTPTPVPSTLGAAEDCTGNTTWSESEGKCIKVCLPGWRRDPAIDMCYKNCDGGVAQQNWATGGCCPADQQYDATSRTCVPKPGAGGATAPTKAGMGAGLILALVAAGAVVVYAVTRGGA